MQISTNWSVSHLRHWRPPVTSTGHDLNRYTGGSWFKSKQSALRSILPNANIHHNENRPGRGQGQTPGVHVGACFSTWGVGGQQVPFWTPRSSTHQTGPRRFHTTWTEWNTADCFPVGAVEGGWSQNTHCDSYKKVLGVYEGLMSLSRGSWWSPDGCEHVGVEVGWGWLVWVTMIKTTTERKF